jgi:hypothetical protein
MRPRDRGWGMTKLEAWHAWSVVAHAERLSSQFTLDNSSHGKAFSFAWDAAVKAEREACAKVCEENADCCNKGSPLHTILSSNAAAIRARGTSEDNT